MLRNGSVECRCKAFVLLSSPSAVQVRHVDFQITDSILGPMVLGLRRPVAMLQIPD